MSQHVLRLFIDRLEPRAEFAAPLAGANRAIYVAEGMTTMASDGVAATLSANSGWFCTAPLTIGAGADGAVLLRYELVGQDAAEGGETVGDGVRSERLLDAAMTLDDPDGYLMRCDKVELPPGGIAYTHVHRGGGIRCLLAGGFNIRVHGETTVVGPYEAWFEAGPDPVYAWAPDDLPGHFSRVMILPRRLKGQSSIRYVNPDEDDKPRRQKYTVFVDAFITL